MKIKGESANKGLPRGNCFEGSLNLATQPRVTESKAKPISEHMKPGDEFYLVGDGIKMYLAKLIAEGTPQEGLNSEEQIRRNPPPAILLEIRTNRPPKKYLIGAGYHRESGVLMLEIEGSTPVVLSNPLLDIKIAARRVKAAIKGGSQYFQV